MVVEGSSPRHLGAAELTVWASGGGAERDPEAKAITTIIILITRTMVIIIIIRILPACTQKPHVMKNRKKEALDCKLHGPTLAPLRKRAAA